jgi:2-C-methyl-D-erythritol 4-phosphate cytidylyltransferase
LSVWAVVAAAGSGERLGLDRPKAFARLGELPMLAETLIRLDGSEWVDGIVVAAPAGWEEPAILLAEEVAAGKVSTCVAGAATRTGSVRNALAEVPADALAVVVHDAARPLLPPDVLDRVLAPLSEGWDGVVPTLALSDTVKRVRGDEVVETVDRSELVVAQTPQAFVADVLRRAVADGADATDCAALVEAGGGRVKAVSGDARLVKVTTREDLELVQSWL